MSNQIVAFNEIPFDWLKPGALAEVRPNYKRMGLVAYPQRTLLIVQRLTAGSVPALQRREITRDDEGRAFFGQGSIGDRMCRAYRRANKTQPLFAIALDDVGGGAQATGTITIAGTATASGTLALYVGGQRVPVAVTNGMTAAACATAIAAAITANPDLEVTAAAVAAVVTCTARHRGAVGNDIDLRVNRFLDDFTPAGLTVTIVAMASGATNPNVQQALDAIAGEWFTDIVMPWTDGANITALATELAARYRAMGRRDAHGWITFRGTYGQQGTFGALSNSPFISARGYNRPGTSTWEISATRAGVAAFHLTNDPSRQLRTLEEFGTWIDASNVFTEQESELLLRQGISSFTRLDDGTVTFDREITMYKQSPTGAADRAWLDVMVPKTMSRIRYDWIGYSTLLYPRNKLAPDYSPAADADPTVVTPRRYLGSWAARCKIYERQGWIQNVSRTVEESTAYIDPNDKNRLNASLQTEIIGNLMVMASALEFQV
jgi:phage tail sheath gpL-like